MDFEFGNRIAKKIGTRHTKMPLNTYRYNQEELIDISCRVDHQINLFYHPPIWDLDKLFSNGVILSGFFGGRSSGSYVFLENSKTLDEAKKRYINKNFVVNSVDLVYKEKDKLEELVEWPGYDPDKMNFDEQLDFVNRQLKNTAPNNLFRGFDFKTPFLYQPLLDFMLSLPKKMRYNQYLYKKIFIQNFPDLFSLPCKTTFGLPPSTGQFRSRFKQIHTSIRREIRRLFSSIPDPYLNYIAFNREIIEREDLNRIVYTNIMDLKRRNMLDWIDIDGIWDEHIHRNRDHTRALLVLASLEIHLKAGKTI